MLLYYNKQIVALIYAQMEEHYEETNSGFEARVSKGFITLSQCNYTLPANESPRDFRMPVANKSDIRRMIFCGFQKCIFPMLKFDTDPERRFVCILELDQEVLRWLRPASRMFQIDYQHGDAYEPDFVVETENRKYICEVKRRTDLEHPEVLAKKDAAITWCSHATKATGSTWIYILIPDDAISENQSFAGICSKYFC